MTNSKIELQRQSPGFRRMQERLGPDAAEKLRQDTMRLQEAAASSVNNRQGSIDHMPDQKSKRRRKK